MTDHQAARRAGEASVGDESDRLAETGADDRRGDAQHLAHPRSARRPLVPDNEHVTVADVAAGRLPADVVALTGAEEAWQTR